MTMTPTNLGRAPARYEVRLRNTQRGNLVRLAMFLAASLLLGQLQARQGAGGVAIQESVAALVTPAIGALAVAGDALRDAASAAPRAGRLAAENRRLRSEIEQMRTRSTALAEAARERERLRRLLDLQSDTAKPSVAATVIGRRLSGWPEAVIINKGRAEGLHPRQPVVAPAGLVGRVYSTCAHTAVVVPLTDRNSSAGAMTQRSRDTGILTGDGDGCQLQYLPPEADVKAGDIVVSSGLGGIFPKGLMIGVVVAVERDDAASMKRARVRQAVSLSRLEEVLVLGK